MRALQFAKTNRRLRSPAATGKTRPPSVSPGRPVWVGADAPRDNRCRLRTAPACAASGRHGAAQVDPANKLRRYVATNVWSRRAMRCCRRRPRTGSSRRKLPQDSEGLTDKNFSIANGSVPVSYARLAPEPLMGEHFSVAELLVPTIDRAPIGWRGRHDGWWDGVPMLSTDPLACCGHLRLDPFLVERVHDLCWHRLG